MKLGLGLGLHDRAAAGGGDPAGNVSNLLLESGDDILLENDDFLLTE